MRGLITLILVLSLGWSAWWLIGTTAQKSAIETWMEQRRDAGWTAEVEEFKVIGYPNRFDSIFTDLTLSNPDAGWTWQAPHFQLLALSYKPNHIIAVWPGVHSYSTRDDTTTITSSLFRGSLIFKPDTALSLDRMQLETTELTLAGESGWHASAEAASIAFFAHNTPDVPPNSYDLYLKALEFSPSSTWRDSLDQSDALPDTIPEVIFDATLTYDNPWDRFAIEHTNPRMTAIQIRDLRFLWGDLNLNGTGAIGITNEGFFDGTFTLQAKKWRPLLDLIIAAQLLTPEFGTALDRGISLVATLAGNPSDLEVKLRFADNLTYIGPIPIGPAPRVY
ncbi:hypothetical protein A9Q96_15435 [Rhodobacterales bacterium 52_120_T64]|nr:hypothetical protein A9Q96_15435 [Rhodobacterales bacterium 52_120_T64]